MELMCPYCEEEFELRDEDVSYIQEILSEGNVGSDIDHGRLPWNDCLALLKKIKATLA